MFDELRERAKKGIRTAVEWADDNTRHWFDKPRPEVKTAAPKAQPELPKKESQIPVQETPSQVDSRNDWSKTLLINSKVYIDGVEITDPVMKAKVKKELADSVESMEESLNEMSDSMSKMFDGFSEGMNRTFRNMERNFDRTFNSMFKIGKK